MAYILVRHKVQDFEKWKLAFDRHGSTREASGSKGGLLFRNAQDPSEVIILLEWEDLEQACQFAQSQALRQAMEQAGVVDKPDVFFLEEAERPSV
jgi:heme-degrading monooxygenase HmoA